jgi:hypothetical protein
MSRLEGKGGTQWGTRRRQEPLGHAWFRIQSKEKQAMSTAHEHARRGEAAAVPATALGILVLAFGLMAGPAATLAAEALSPAAEALVDQATSIEREGEGQTFLASLPKKGEGVAVARGIALHNLCRIKTDPYLRQAVAVLEAESRTSAIARAYLGSVRTISGGDALAKGDVATATAATEQGLKTIDEGLAMDPRNVLIRILRLSNGLEVARTSPFKRYEVLGEDVEFLLKQLDGMDPSTRAEVWCLKADLDLATRHLDAALAAYERAVRAAAGSKFGKLARKALEQLEE